MMAEPAGTQNESDGVAFKVEGDEHARARRYEEADRSYTRSLVAAPRKICDFPYYTHKYP